MRQSGPLLTGVALWIMLGSGVLVMYLPKGTNEVTVSRLVRLSDSGRVAFEVHNRMHRAIRLDRAEVLTRLGSQWGIGDDISLGGTNCTTQAYQFEVEPPKAGIEWKVRLAYAPEVTGATLLKWRLKYAWGTRKVFEGLRLTVWDYEQYAFSEEFHR